MCDTAQLEKTMSCGRISKVMLQTGSVINSDMLLRELGGERWATQHRWELTDETDKNSGSACPILTYSEQGENSAYRKCKQHSCLLSELQT